MNAAHVHLFLNHVPVIGFGLGVLSLVAGMIRQSEELKKAGLVLFFVCGLLTIPVYFSGQRAEDVVEHLPGVSEAVIEEHEEIALPSLIGAVLLGLISLAGLILWRGLPVFPRWFFTLTLLLSLIVSGYMTFTANLGGQIRHTEVRSGSAPSGEPEVGLEQEHED